VAPPLLIVSPLFPPARGGLPDHADRLAAALHGPLSVTVLTSPGVDTDRPFAVRGELARWHDPGAVLDAVARVASSGPVLWEYVPHMYGRGGVNLALPAVWRALRRQGRRQVAIAHEIAGPFSWWPHRSLYALAHRLQWRALVRTADAIGISTAGWLERIQRSPGRWDHLFLAPSPANVPTPLLPADHRDCWRAKQGLAAARQVVGYYGTIGAGKQFDWVLGAWRTALTVEPATALVVVGADPTEQAAAGERAWMRGLGYVPAGDAAEALQAMDLLLLPFVDGVSERRSSFMAALANGVPVLTTVGPATGRELRSAGCYLAADGGRAGFAQETVRALADRARLRQLGARGARHYAGRYDWPVLAAALIQAIPSRASTSLASTS
jgi:glycosyltransferase involved in cell wall biosynthesis